MVLKEKMNLEYYRVFCEVADAGSISAAAQKLCISQPAVSQNIKLLERELGGCLFERSSKGMQLSKEGELLYSYVKKGYEYMMLGEEKYKNMLNMESGEIVIGASDMSLQYYLLPYLEKYHEMFPDIKITVTNAPTPETLENLKLGKIDFGIVSTPFGEDKDIEAINVRSLKTVFVAGNDYAQYKGKVLSLRELEKLPLICLEKNTSTRKATDIFFKENNVVREPEFELATSDIIVQFAKRNLGVGIVVYDFAKAYIEDGTLFEMEFEKKLKERQMAVVRMKKNYLSTAAKRLIDIMGI